jgi:hypothetical protein
MSTPQEATELNPTAWEGTPVVIKTGGGQTEGETEGETKGPFTMPCSITVDSLKRPAFVSTLMGNQWQSAKSDQLASIKWFTIVDNGNLPRTIEHDQPGLAVLQISYGPETLIIQEVLVPNSENKKVTISSSLPFGAETAEWKGSTGEVPAEHPVVVFTQGGIPADPIPCTSLDVTITIEIEWGPMK